jgi:hypothetical protein
MIAALKYARGEDMQPREYTMRRYIQIYGAAAVMNRDYLGVGEIRRMEVSAAIIEGYRSREASGNWAEWSAKNPDIARMLVELERENG